MVQVHCHLGAMESRQVAMYYNAVLRCYVNTKLHGHTYFSMVDGRVV